jgi:predicted cupin superfamily sugar epimerase
VTAAELIERLQLRPHPKEGGYFRETYRSSAGVAAEHLPPGYTGPRSLGTAIYYLLTSDTISAMHRLPGDEIFHHYLGHAVEMLMLHPNGRSETVIIGSDIASGQRPQVVVPGGTWQGSRLAPATPAHAFALLGCTMAPGFDYADYAHGERDALTRQYAERAEHIRRLTFAS